MIEISQPQASRTTLKSSIYPLVKGLIFLLILLLAISIFEGSGSNFILEACLTVLGFGAGIYILIFLFIMFKSVIKSNNKHIINGDCISGDGECYFNVTIDEQKHKETYIGSFENGMRNGKGLYSFTNGDSYDGNWKEDMMTGTGVYNWNVGYDITIKSPKLYEGEFKNNEIHGRGKLTFASGKVQGGIWDYGVFKED